LADDMEIIILPISILFITGPIAARVFIVLLEKSHWRGLAILWLGLGLTAVLLGLFITYTFGNFFPGPGCFTSLLTPLFAIVTFLTFRFRAKRIYEALSGDWARRRWFMAGTLLIPFLQLSAPVISYGYGQTCDALNRQAAESLIVALEKHKTETGSYSSPSDLDSPYQADLEFLVPRYVPSIPPHACAVAFFNRPDPYYPVDDSWNLYHCNNSPGHEVLLMVPIIGSDSQQIYNLSTGQWSRGNALDGYCNYLN